MRRLLGVAAARHGVVDGIGAHLGQALATGNHVAAQFLGERDEGCLEISVPGHVECGMHLVGFIHAGLMVLVPNTDLRLAKRFHVHIAVALEVVQRRTVVPAVAVIQLCAGKVHVAQPDKIHQHLSPAHEAGVEADELEFVNSRAADELAQGLADLLAGQPGTMLDLAVLRIAPVTDELAAVIPQDESVSLGRVILHTPLQEIRQTLGIVHAVVLG